MNNETIIKTLLAIIVKTTSQGINAKAGFHIMTSKKGNISWDAHKEKFMYNLRTLRAKNIITWRPSYYVKNYVAIGLGSKAKQILGPYIDNLKLIGSSKERENKILLKMLVTNLVNEALI